MSTRNYKMLAIAIPVTFFLGFLLVDPPIKSVAEPIPSPAAVETQVQKPVVKKKIRKKIKKQEEENNDDGRVEVQLPEENQEETHD